MSQYKLTFNAKSSSKNVPLALRLAEKMGTCTYSGDKKTICIMTDVLSPDLKKILELVKNVKGTLFEIHGTLVIDMVDVHNVLHCLRKRRCDGICTAIKDYDFELEFIGITGKDPYCLYNADRWDLYPHDDVINVDENLMHVDTMGFYDHYIEDTWVPPKMCPKYSRDSIRSAFNSFPEVIEIELKPDIDEFMMNPDVESTSSSSDVDMVVHLSGESIKRLGDEIELRMLQIMKNKGLLDEKK